MNKLYLYLALHVIFLFCNVFTFSIENNNPSKLISMLDCAINIYKTTEEKYAIIQSFQLKDLHHILNKIDCKIVINSKNNIIITNNKYKFNYNIMIANDFNEFKFNIYMFYRTYSWNAKAKYLVVFKENINLTEVFELSWKIYLLNIVVIYNNEIFTYFPYEGISCGNILPNKLSTCDLEVNLVEYYQEKIPKNLHNCPIKALQLYFPPYVTKPNNTDNPGLEIVMVNELAKRLNFSVIYVDHKFLHYGFKYGKGIYSNLYKLMYNYQGDMIFGTLKLNVSFHEEFDTIYPHMIDAVTWYAPRARQIAPYKNLFIVFQKSLWIILIAIFIMIVPTWWLIGNASKSYQDTSFIHYFLLAWYSLLLGSVRQPQKLIMRIFFITWIMSTFLLSTTYQSKFTSILTTPVYDKQISNEEDIINSGLQYGFDPMVRGEFNNSEDRVRWTIYKNFFSCNFENTLYCVNRTIKNRDLIVAKNKKNMIWCIQHYHNQTGLNAVYEFEQDAYTYLLRILVNQGFPLIEPMKNLVLLFRQNGLLLKWVKDAVAKIQKTVVDDIEVKKLSRNHLQGAFLILFGGMFISFVTFVLEIILFKLLYIKIEGT